MLISYFIYKICCNKPEGIKEIILNKYEYEVNISKYDLTVLNLNTELYDMKYSLMAYINDINFEENLFSYYTKFYNHFWLFYISDLKILNQLLNKHNSKNDYMTIYGVIIPENLKNKLNYDFNKNAPSIFVINDNFSTGLKESDFRTNDKITYFTFDTKKPISRYPEQYYVLLSLLIFSFSGIILMFWFIFY